MANEDLIRGGTASVDNGSTVVTGAGSTSWTVVREGDFFGAHVGLLVPIESVAPNAITLAYPWPGPTQNNAAYAIQPKGDTVRFMQRVAEMVEFLTDGGLAAIAALPSGENKLPYYTGEGTAALTTLSAFMRTLLDDGDATTALATLTAQLALTKTGLLEFGADLTGNRDAIIDLHARDGSDYDLRIARLAGANGNSQILHTGSGIMDIRSNGGAIQLNGGSDLLRDGGKIWHEGLIVRNLGTSGGLIRLPLGSDGKGLLIQTGTVASGIGSAPAVVFPTAFPTYLAFVKGAITGAAASDNVLYSVETTARSLSGCTFRKTYQSYDANSHGGASEAMTWLAVGW